MTGTQIRTLREQYGYTRAELAKIVGVDARSVSRWESKQNEYASVPSHVFGMLTLLDNMRDHDAVLAQSYADCILGTGVGYMLMMDFLKHEARQKEKA